MGAVAVPGKWFYDLMYRIGAPWEIGVRTELLGLVEAGRLAPGPRHRAIDLGCGSGANAIFLAQRGWETVGVDFSSVAVRKARSKAAAAGMSPEVLRFVVGDLTADAIEGAPGPFDLLLDYGTLDDLKGGSRQRMADLATRLASPGARFLLWCFYAHAEDLPLMSFSGPSRVTPAIEPGELERRFGEGWVIEHLPEPPPDTRTACFLLTRKP